MNILYLAQIRLPTEKAHGIQIMKTCEAFTTNGAKVTLLVPSQRGDIQTDPFTYYNVERNFKIIQVYCPDLVRFGKFGFILMNIWFSQICSVYTWKIKPDVVYSRDYFLLLDQYLLPFKKVWEVHDGLWNNFIKYMKVDGIVTISQGLKNFFKEHGKKNIIVAHDAVDLSEFNTQEKSDLDLPANEKIIMYIGHLYGWKGTDTLLAASKEIKGKLVIIGGVDHEVRKLQKEYPHVIFKGYIPYTELPKNQKRADLLVIPNSGKSDISRLYTSPLKVFAHMASGVPILASDLPSLREILNDSNAYFAEADDAQSFAEKINYVLDHQGEATTKAQKAFQDVRQYTWENRAKIILDFCAIFCL